MSEIRLLLITFLAALLIGCAGGATQEGMVYQPELAPEFDPGLANAVAIDSVSGGEKTNPLWTSEISNESFAAALKATLDGLGLWSDSGRYQLRIEMQKVDQPAFGFDMTVTTQVNYQLFDSQTNTLIMDKTIIAEFTATVDDAFAGVKRLRLANEGSARKNIEDLINRLSKLNLSDADISLAM